jgi:hypothetical protein
MYSRIRVNHLHAPKFFTHTLPQHVYILILHLLTSIVSCILNYIYTILCIFYLGVQDYAYLDYND